MTPSITAHPLDDYGARTVWSQFVHALGADTMKRCYGWPIAPIMLRPGESAWVYGDELSPSTGASVGWGSLIKDPTTPAYWHASGVFPTFQRMGYRQAIRQHLCGEAFARGAEAVSLVVLDTNPEHLTRCEREEKAGSPWKLSGAIWRPQPGHRIYTLLLEDARLVVPFTDKACCCAHLWLPGECPAEVMA